MKVVKGEKAKGRATRVDCKAVDTVKTTPEPFSPQEATFTRLEIMDSDTYERELQQCLSDIQHLFSQLKNRNIPTESEVLFRASAAPEMTIRLLKQSSDRFVEHIDATVDASVINMDNGIGYYCASRKAQWQAVFLFWLDWDDTSKSYKLAAAEIGPITRRNVHTPFLREWTDGDWSPQFRSLSFLRSIARIIVRAETDDQNGEETGSAVNLPD